MLYEVGRIITTNRRGSALPRKLVAKSGKAECVFLLVSYWLHWRSDEISYRGGVSRLSYNEFMARGWESKSVEAQQSEAAEQSSKSRRQRLSPEESAQVRQRENLLLARRRVLQQLAENTDKRLEKLLQETLNALDERLQKMG